MSQSDQLFVFAGIVLSLSNDFDQMPAHFILLHECTHVLWHVTYVNKEFASLGVNSFCGRDVPHILLLRDLSCSLFLTVAKS